MHEEIINTLKHGRKNKVVKRFDWNSNREHSITNRIYLGGHPSVRRKSLNHLRYFFDHLQCSDYVFLLCTVQLFALFQEKTLPRPNTRSQLKNRSGQNRPRKINCNLSQSQINVRYTNIQYGCSGKHKSNPFIYGLAPYHGQDSDRSLCDRDAQFLQSDLSRIPDLFDRSRRAGLLDKLIWTVDNTGWVYELQITNSGQNCWHGYPLFLQDEFAKTLIRYFTEWAAINGTDIDKCAAQAARQLYGVR